jgi:hypothetical protein
MRVCYSQIIPVEDVSIAAVSIRVSANWMKFFHIASMLMKKGGQTEEVGCNGLMSLGLGLTSQTGKSKLSKRRTTFWQGEFGTMWDTRRPSHEQPVEPPLPASKSSLWGRRVIGSSRMSLRWRDHFGSSSPMDWVCNASRDKSSVRFL